VFLSCFEEFWFLVFVTVRGCSDGKLNCRSDAVVAVSFFLSLCGFLWPRGLGLSVFYFQALLRFSVSDHCLSICFCFWHFLSRGL
jgi:hypothetical protein